jgi:ubiquinone/menaquinone biosynthesis C-methylase UbiE
MVYVADLVKKLRAGADVLGLGCDTGVPATQVLNEHGLKVTRNDISAAQISLAREHIPQATLIQGDMLGLDDAAASFDAMLGFYSIPKEEEQALMIEKTKGWLKPGGWLLCNLHIEEGDVTREGWIEPDIKKKKFQRARSRGHKRYIPPGFKLLVDEIDVETVGKFEKMFHWIMAVKDNALAD